MAKNAKINTTVGVFSTRAAAGRAIDELKNAGYRDNQIGVVARDPSGRPVARGGSGAPDTHAAQGAALGAGPWPWGRWPCRSGSSR